MHRHSRPPLIEALALLEPHAESVARDIYIDLFTRDATAADLFPANLGPQRHRLLRVLRYAFTAAANATQHERLTGLLRQLGRDHRKYGVTPEHYRAMRASLLTVLARYLGEDWEGDVRDAVTAAIDLVVTAMDEAARDESGPPWWDATVTEHLRVSRDIAVIRVRSTIPVPYRAGQYLPARAPQFLRAWRYLSPATPPTPEGDIEFHVKAISGGMFSRGLVTCTQVGDVWRLGTPLGRLAIDRRGGDDVLLIAGGTGLAPLRAMIMDLTRHGRNPRVHLFYGARYPGELHDLSTLWQLSSYNPWLSVTPVTEYEEDPSSFSAFPVEPPPRGLHVRQHGKLADVVTSYGNWSDRHILIAGSPAMISATREALHAKGTPLDRIHHDPI